MTLKVKPEQVEATAGSIKSKAERMYGILTDLYNEVNRMPDSVWESRSGRDFRDRFRNVHQNCQNAITRLTQHNTNLINAALKYQEIEDQNQQARVGSLESKNIFS